MTNPTWGSGLLWTCGRVLRSVGNRLLNNRPKKDNFTVAIEGNIGSGKTSLLQHFMGHPEVEVIKEPVDKWRNVQGHNALALMYEDPARWSLTFQTYVQLTMLEAHAAPNTARVKLMERSIFSAKYCFVENLHQSGKMPDLEYIVLSRWFDWICDNESVGLDLIVYLRTQPETVHERIRRRCRREEEAIPIEYLRSLHQLHENWLIGQKTFPLPCPVLVLDADAELDRMKDVFDSHRHKILCGRR